MTFPLEQQSEIRPDSIALVWKQREYSFLNLYVAVEMQASFLRKNIRKNLPRVGILGDNSDRWIIALLAGWRCGFCMVPLSPNWTDIEISKAIKNVEMDVIIVSEKHKSRVPESISHAAILLDTPFREEFQEENRLQSYYQYSDDEPALILFTSGTSGQAKRVLLSWESLVEHAKMSAEHLGYTSKDSWLVTLPLNHIGGLSTIVKSLVTGIKVILDPKFDAVQTTYLIEKNEPTYTSLVPIMLNRLIEEYGGRLNDCFKNALIGGGPISEELILSDERFLATYGMSEAGSQICTVPPESSDSVRKTSGFPLPGVEIVIRDDNNEPLPEGKVGSVWVKSPALAIGYDDVELTNKRFVDGWLDSGDYGQITEDGCLKIDMRRDDRIVTGGENVNPYEVESLLKKHPFVEDVAVVALSDDVWGQIVGAVVVFNAASCLTVSEFKSYLSDKLSGYKIPKAWMKVENLPLLPNEKLDRRQIIENFSNNID